MMNLQTIDLAKIYTRRYILGGHQLEYREKAVRRRQSN